jgi:uncharacterized membrane protein HdeD (DUF308 family)
MLDFLAKNWWVLVVRGAAAVLFGVLAFVYPIASLGALILLWGAYALVDGVFSIVGAFRRAAGEGVHWWMLLTGLVGVAAGIVAFANPALTAIALLLLIGAFAVVRGVMLIAAAIRLRKEIEHEWLLVLSGIVSLVFGVLVMTYPGAGALAIVVWIGAFAVVVGVLEIIAGVRLKAHGVRSAPRPA